MRDSNVSKVKGDSPVGPVGVPGIGREVTLNRAAADAPALLPWLIEDIPAGVVVAYGGPLFPIVTVNQAAEQLLGCSRVDLLGRPAAAHPTSFTLAPMGQSVRQACLGLPLHRAACLGHIIHDEQWSLMRSDGSSRVVLVNANPLRTVSGATVGGVMCLRDISALKRAERELRQSEERLREADQRKDRFLAILAHELRGPLAPVQSVAEVLRIKAKADPELARVSNVLRRQVADMARLLNDVLDLSRVAVGKLRIERRRVELAEVIAHAIEWAKPAIAERQHRLDVSLPTRALVVEGDPGRLAQVFFNLLTNAAKYTDPGGYIGVRMTAAGGAAVVRVRDSGRGLEEADMKCLFDLFFQPERTLDCAEGGLGIGLSLVRTLVEMHGGSVHAHSPGRGKGSEFAIALPLAAGEVVTPG